MWVHSSNKDRETHGEYVIIYIGIFYHIYWNIIIVIFNGICHNIYWNMLSYLLEYITIFIGICHIYLLLNNKSDKIYIQNNKSVKFL